LPLLPVQPLLIALLVRIGQAIRQVVRELPLSPADPALTAADRRRCPADYPVMGAPYINPRPGTGIMADGGLRPGIQTGELHHSPHPRQHLLVLRPSLFSFEGGISETVRPLQAQPCDLGIAVAAVHATQTHTPDSGEQRARGRGGTRFDSHAPRGVGTRIVAPTSAQVATPSEIPLTTRIRSENQS